MRSGRLRAEERREERVEVQQNEASTGPITDGPNDSRIDPRQCVSARNRCGRHFEKVEHFAYNEPGSAARPVKQEHSSFLARRGLPQQRKRINGRHESTANIDQSADRRRNPRNPGGHAGGEDLAHVGGREGTNQAPDSEHDSVQRIRVSHLSGRNEDR